MENNSIITHPVQTVSVRYCICVVYVCVWCQLSGTVCVWSMCVWWQLSGTIMCCAPYVVLKGSGTACVVSTVLNYDIIRVQSDNVLGRQACSLLREYIGI